MNNSRGSSERSRRVALALLAIYFAVAAIILLAPVGYAGSIARIAAWLRDSVGLGFMRSSLVEFAANIVLFAPVGLLLTYAARRWWVGTIAGLIVSAAAELGQLLVPQRVTSVRDVVANTLGAAVGSVLALAYLRWRVSRRPENLRSP